MPQFRKNLSFLFKTLITLVLLVFIFYGIHWKEFLATLSRVDIGWLIISSLIVLAGEALIALRLKVLLSPTSFDLPVFKLLKIGFIAWFYAFFLPSGLGLGIARWFLITGNKRGRLIFAFVTFIEKSLFFAVCILSIAVPLIVIADNQTAGLRKALLPVLMISLVAMAILFALVLFPPANRKVGEWLEAIKNRIKYRLDFLAEIRRVSSLYSGQLDKIGEAGILTLLVQFAILTRIIMLFYAVGVDLPIVTALWIAALVFLIQALPISFAGLGVRESAFAYAFGLYGLRPESGVAVGVLFLGQLIMCALIGGMLRVIGK